MTTSSLKALAELILKNVDVLESDLAKRGVTAPSLDEVFTPGSDFTTSSQEVLQAADTACHAALQLVQTIRTPALSLLQTSFGVSIIPLPVPDLNPLYQN